MLIGAPLASDTLATVAQGQLQQLDLALQLLNMKLLRSQGGLELHQAAHQVSSICALNPELSLEAGFLFRQLVTAHPERHDQVGAQQAQEKQRGHNSPEQGKKIHIEGQSPAAA
ncbi:TPA: hypothetical protein ACNIDQ_000072 [Pseudomonas aeruginosa]